MAKLYYRGMAEQNGKPKIGRSARLLGVRPSIDINIEEMPTGCLDEQRYLLSESQRELNGDLVVVAIQDTKGMSVPFPSKAYRNFASPHNLVATAKILYGKLMTASSPGIYRLSKIAQPLVLCQELQCP